MMEWAYHNYHVIAQLNDNIPLGRPRLMLKN